MSYTSNFNLNQRVSYLESEINKIAPIPVGGYNLANVLTIGNSAGATDINLNNQDILNVNTLLLIDGSNNASLDINQVNGNLDIVTTGFPTFNNLPRCSDVPTNADELVNKAYADSIASTNATTISITDASDNNTYYPTFVTGTGTGQSLRTDFAPSGLTYNPSTATLTATNISGNISGNISVTNNNSNTVMYPVFVQNNSSGIKPLLQDGLSTTLTYNPSSGTLTCDNFNGSATSAVTVSVTSDNTNGNYFIPFTKFSGSSVKNLFQDDTTGPLSYNPSLRQLTVSSLTPDAADTSASLTFVERCFIRRVAGFGATMGNMNFQSTHAVDYAVYMGDSGENNINAPASNVTYPNTRLNLRIGNTNYMTIDGNSSRLGNIGIRNGTPTEVLDVNGNIRSNTSVLTPQVGNPTGNLNIRVNNTGAGGTLSLTGGTGLLSGSASGNSGQHLVVTINGTAYKIALLNP